MEFLMEKINCENIFSSNYNVNSLLLWNTSTYGNCPTLKIETGLQLKFRLFDFLILFHIQSLPIRSKRKLNYIYVQLSKQFLNWLFEDLFPFSTISVCCGITNGGKYSVLLTPLIDNDASSSNVWFKRQILIELK